MQGASEYNMLCECVSAPGSDRIFIHVPTKDGEFIVRSMSIEFLKEVLRDLDETP